MFFDIDYFCTKYYYMPKGISKPKDFKRFKASRQVNLLLLQSFTFAVHNARLKLKEDKFRTSDILTVYIVGEMKEDGCKVSEFKNVVGVQTSVAQNMLTRAKNRNILGRAAGRRGRGHAATYYLSASGSRIYRIVQAEMGTMLNEVLRALLVKLNRVR